MQRWWCRAGSAARSFVLPGAGGRSELCPGQLRPDPALLVDGQVAGHLVTERDGTLIRLGGVPGMGTRRSVRARSSLGIEVSSPHAYGWAGRSKISAPVPYSAV